LATDLVKSKAVSPARLAAFEILRRVEEGAFASILLAKLPHDLTQQDRSLCNELVLGILRRKLFLDLLIEHYSKRKIASLDLGVRIALWLGLYQIRFLSRIPDSAAINESVNLVKRARLRSAEGFVNAVLRRATREPDYDPRSGVVDPVEQLVIETSHPHWLVERWVKSFGYDFAAEFARSNNEPPPIAFRVVKNKADESTVIAQLRNEGATVHESPIAKGAWRLEGKATLLSSLGAEGKVYIQDEASQLVGTVLAPETREWILDLCAAPGSKTSEIADISGNRAVVIASDFNEARLSTVTKTATLHGLSSVKCCVLDGLKPLPFQPETFDAVLVDAPCSGTGTLRRNPEIRWRISPADLLDLAGRQTQLLANAAHTVKPGGRLVYSTCSVEPEENEEVVRNFLEAMQNFEQVEVEVSPTLGNRQKTIRTWPHRHAADGFFMTVFRRRSV
jgi:16S rRNA (cytosine967-C5)-methyltransferase